MRGLPDFRRGLMGYDAYFAAIFRTVFKTFVSLFSFLGFVFYSVIRNGAAAFAFIAKR